jgi:hypothetical protein
MNTNDNTKLNSLTHEDLMRMATEGRLAQMAREGREASDRTESRMSWNQRMDLEARRDSRRRSR